MYVMENQDLSCPSAATKQKKRRYEGLALAMGPEPAGPAPRGEGRLNDERAPAAVKIVSDFHAGRPVDLDLRRSALAEAGGGSRCWRGPLQHLEPSERGTLAGAGGASDPTTVINI